MKPQATQPRISTIRPHYYLPGKATVLQNKAPLLAVLITLCYLCRR